MSLLEKLRKLLNGDITEVELAARVAVDKGLTKNDIAYIVYPATDYERALKKAVEDVEKTGNNFSYE
jgi:hypothetical protein